LTYKLENSDISMKRSEVLNEKTFIKCNGAGENLTTGSCWLLGIRDSRIMIDCGLYQGKYEERSVKGIRRNFDPMKDIAGVTEIIQTHPHMDHIGRTPMVFKNGFTPTILATKETAEFMGTMLYNSAKIQELKRLSNQLYNRRDVEEILKHVKNLFQNSL
jgi:metallo-beta-lactamase family protein